MEQNDPAPTARGYQYWLCTWNNPTDDWWLDVCSSGATYCAGQLEVGESGTKHGQFMLYFQKNGISFNSLKKKLPKCALFGKHCSAAQDIWDYCKKTETAVADTWKEWGKIPKFSKTKEKKKDHYQDTLEHCRAGHWEFASAEHQVKHLPNLVKLTAHYACSCDCDKPRGVWLYGPPGSGKSYTARHQFPSPVYLKPQNKWFDNYRGEPTIILDDFDHNGSCLSHLLKIWADGYGCKGEIKGGTVALQHTTFIITSNYLPIDLWPGDGNQVLRDAIIRRFRFGTVKGKHPDFQIIWDEEKNEESTEEFGVALLNFLNK